MRQIGTTGRLRLCDQKNVTINHHSKISASYKKANFDVIVVMKGFSGKTRHSDLPRSSRQWGSWIPVDVSETQS